MKFYSLAFLLTSSLTIPLSQGNAFSLFNKSSTNADQLKQQIKTDIKNLSTLRELFRLSRQMEAVYLQAKSIGLNAETKIKIQDTLIKEYNLAQENLTKFKDEWIQKRQLSLKNLKTKNTLKTEQISQLTSELKQLEVILENLQNILESLTPEGKILLLATWNFAVNPTLPQGSNAKQMFEWFTKLNNKITQSRKQLDAFNNGIIRLDSVLQNVENDPRFKRDHDIAMARLAEAKRQLTNIGDTYNNAMKPLLNSPSQKAQTLTSSFEEKAKSLGCSALTRIGDGQRGINQCREQSLKRINDAAKKIKLKSCQLSVQSDDPSIEACAKEFGLSYLNLTQK
ncbi:MAG: hypothetical protein BGO77_05130 [Caedibacter sp. 37-49]|nr:MAG: hypothetical protein BGO77_05130 [Caedibacter sp. 37-49]